MVRRFNALFSPLMFTDRHLKSIGLFIKKVLEFFKSLDDCSYVRAFGQLSLRLTAIYTIT